MSGNVVQTTIKISALDAASGKLAAIGGNIGTLERRFSNAQRRISATLNNIAMTGAGMTVGFTLPFARGLDASLDKIEDFETNTVRLANAFDAPIEKMAIFQKQAMDLAPKTPFGAAQIVGAQLELKMAGFSQDEILRGVPDVLNFATIAEISVPEAAKLGSDVLRGLGADVGELGNILDMAGKAATLSNQSALQFMQGLVRSAPIAKAAGIPVQDLIAQLATLADAGFKASEGGNALRTILLRLAAPTSAAQRQFARLGINISDFGAGRLSSDGILSTLKSTGAVTIAEAESIRAKVEATLTKPLPEGVTRQQLLSSEIVGALGADSKQQEMIASALAEAIGSSVSGLDYSGLLQAVRSRADELGLDPLPIIKDIAGVMRSAQFEALSAGAGKLDSLAANILDSSGMSSRAAERLMETTGGLRNAFRSVLEVTAVEFGESGLKDLFKEFLVGSITALNAFRALDESTKKVIAITAAVAAAVGPALIVVSLLGKAVMMLAAPFAILASGAMASIGAIGALLSPIGLVVAAIGTLAVWAGKDLFAFLKDFEPLKAVFERISDGFKLIFGGWSDGDGNKIAVGIKVIRSQLVDLWGGVKAGAAAWAGGLWGRFADKLDALTGGLGSTVAGLLAVRGAGAAAMAALGHLLSPVARLVACFVRPFRFAARLSAVAIAAGGARGAVAGLASIMGGALMRVAGRFGGVLYRLFLSPRALGIIAITEAFIALAQNADKVREALGKVAEGKWQEGFKDIWGVLRDSFSPEAATLLGAGVALHITKGILGGRWKRVGALAGAAWSLGFRATAGAGSLLGRMGRGIGGKLLGVLSLGGLFSSLRGKMAAGIAKAGIGVFVMKTLGKVLLRAVPIVGWALLALDIARFFFPQIDKALSNVWGKVKALAVVGWQKALDAGVAIAKAARKFGRAFFKFHTVTLPGWIAATGKWFGQKFEDMITAAMKAGRWVADSAKALLDEISKKFGEGFAAALEIGQDVIDGLVKSYTDLGTKLSDAIKAPFVAGMDWISDALEGVSEAASGIGAVLGITGDEGEGSTAPSGPRAPLNPTAFPIPDFSQPDALKSTSRLIVEQMAAPAVAVPDGLLGIKPQQVPLTLAEAGFDRSAGLAAAVREAVAEGLAASGFMDAEAKINVNVKAQGGLQATTSGQGRNANLSLNTGADPLAP